MVVIEHIKFEAICRLSYDDITCSNSLLHQKKNKWIDFNAGVLTETADYETVTEELCRYVLQVASGKLVKAEEAGYHDMAIFKQNITL